VTKTCSQCGAILPSSVRACCFCDSSFIADTSGRDPHSGGSAQDQALRGEVAERLAAYRARRRKGASSEQQSRLPFEGSVALGVRAGTAAVEDPAAEEFSFTIAIGRTSNAREDRGRMIIDLSESSEPTASAFSATQVPPDPGLYPVASLEERRLAGLADMACLLFAYGGFLALFSSLGGQFTISKLSAAVCTATLAIVYMQYFALFTIFGGTTPGMMLRGLHVVSFSGEPPTPRQMLLRSAGYLISAGTFLLGFVWSMWDEDSLTWHDRLSRTYLAEVQTFTDLETSSVAEGR
jgi:uncharacterized RDD family membrane protein YckC